MHALRRRCAALVAGLALVGAGFAAGTVTSAMASGGTDKGTLDSICAALAADAQSVYTCAPVTTSTTSTTAAPTTTTQPPTTTTTVPPPPATVDTVARNLNNMDGVHDYSPADIPTYWSWGLHGEVDSPTPPAGYTAMTAWGQVYADQPFASSEPASGSVRVELKNMVSYVWSNAQRRWLRCQATTQVDGAHFVDNFAGNASIPADWRTEPDGGISTALVPGYNVHFWPNAGRCLYPTSPGDIGAMWTSYDPRLIGANVATAHYEANAGEDDWLDLTAPYPNNAQGGMGRFSSLTGSWQAFDFWTGGTYGAGVPGAWTDAQLQANPPPLDPLGHP